MKRTYTTYYFYFSCSRIEKDDIIPIKVIGTALNKPNLPYIIFEKSTLTLIGCPGLTLLLKIDNVFISLIESGTSSHILGAKDKRPSLP